MNVVPLISRTDWGTWRPDELVELQRLLRLLTCRAGARSSENGSTERGDPQLYVLGAGPEQRCLACVSRLGSVYVLEDGAGTVLAETRSLRELAKSVEETIPRARRVPLTARAFLAACAGRAFLDEKMAAVEESFELLARFA